jgi:hypothetical protein
MTLGPQAAFGAGSADRDQPERRRGDRGDAGEEINQWRR